MEYMAGNGIIIEDGVISVDVTEMVESDNPLPISSNGIYNYVGDIETLLQSI